MKKKSKKGIFPHRSNNFSSLFVSLRRDVNTKILKFKFKYFKHMWNFTNIFQYIIENARFYRETHCRNLRVSLIATCPKQHFRVFIPSHTNGKLSNNTDKPCQREREKTRIAVEQRNNKMLTFYAKCCLSVKLWGNVSFIDWCTHNNTFANTSNGVANLRGDGREKEYAGK